MPLLYYSLQTYLQTINFSTIVYSNLHYHYEACWNQAKRHRFFKMYNCLRIGSQILILCRFIPRFVKQASYFNLFCFVFITYQMTRWPKEVYLTAVCLVIITCLLLSKFIKLLLEPTSPAYHKSCCSYFLSLNAA